VTTPLLSALLTLARRLLGGRSLANVAADTMTFAGINTQLDAIILKRRK
jgi:hypothetical protein